MYQLFIVDDEEVVRKGIRELLQSAENQYAICGEASDGELALPMIQELKPDILLTDIRMPFLDGLELCEMIRAKMPWVHILILSGHDEFEYARKAVSLGVDEYILKPVTMPQLLGSLEKTARKIEEERASYFTGLDTENASARKRGVMVSHFLNELLDEVFSASDALARAEKELGLTQITDEMIAEMESHVNDINYDVAAAEEKKLRHDVMAHVHAYGAQCPKAKGIIHLGATSCYVGDNTDVILMREGLQLVRGKLVQVLAALGKFADEYKAMPTLGFTHFQAAQMVTVGKRATLWMNELLMDLEEVNFRISTLKLLGSKGTTGTQASFMELFAGDTDKVKLLEQKIAAEMGFDAVVPVSGLFPQNGQRRGEHVGWYCRERFQVCHGRAAAVPLERSGRAF